MDLSIINFIVLLQLSIPTGVYIQKSVGLIHDVPSQTGYQNILVPWTQ
jgi:hypothetical protein